jgi:hypothetical protein
LRTGYVCEAEGGGAYGTVLLHAWAAFGEFRNVVIVVQKGFTTKVVRELVDV